MFYNFCFRLALNVKEYNFVKDILGRPSLSDLINDRITTVFIDQPLAKPGLLNISISGGCF